MPEKTIADFIATADLNATDDIPIWQGATRRISVANFRTRSGLAIAPANTVTGRVPQWTDANRTLSTGLEVASTLASPGSDSRLITERAAVVGLSRWSPLIGGSEYATTPPFERHDGTSFVSIPLWAPSTAYAAGSFVRPSSSNGFVYECVSPGTSGASEPAWATSLGSDQPDGTVTWRCRGLHVLQTLVDLTSRLYAGQPVRYVVGTLTRYGVIAAVSATRIAIAGAPLRSDQTVPEFLAGSPGNLIRTHLHVPGDYGSSTGDKLVSVAGKHHLAPPDCRLVWWAARHRTDWSNTQPKINIRIDGGLVSVNDTNQGVLVGASGWRWNEYTAVNVSNWSTAAASALEISVQTAGTGTAGADLSVELWWVSR